MGTPHIGQVDNMRMSTLLFLAWLNTFFLALNTIAIIIWTKVH